MNQTSSGITKEKGRVIIRNEKIYTCGVEQQGDGRNEDEQRQLGTGKGSGQWLGLAWLAGWLAG